jgi:hypothetical protein
MWRELWWKMADGVKSEYDRIKATDVMEFWKLFDLWQQRMEQQREQAQKNKNLQNNGRK